MSNKVRKVKKKSTKVVKEDDFIGSTFGTPKGGVLTVVEKLPKIKGKNVKYLCECSICSEDKELFPELFEAHKGHLVGSLSNKPSVPCGCSYYKWSKKQYKIRIIRECKVRDYEFLGFLEWRDANTMLRLRCLKDGNVWDTTKISNFFAGNGCSVCAKLSTGAAHKLTDYESTLVFMGSGKFLDGTIFKRCERTNNVGHHVYFDMICPLCSYDKYVEEGLCSGVFTSHGSSLREGMLPCRCQRGYCFTREQYEFDIKVVCKEEGLTFLGWIGDYEGVYSKFLWVCSKGHLCSDTIVGSFLGGTRCMECHKLRRGNGNGYYEDRKYEQDYLYTMDFDTPYKVGRTFEVKERINRLKSKAALPHKPKLLQLYTATHEVVYDTEQEIPEELRKRGFQYYCNWTNECFTKDCWNVLQELLKVYVSAGVLTIVTQ